MSDRKKTRVIGKVMEKETGRGTKSHKLKNIVLHTPERDYHLRLNDTNPFMQRQNFEHLIGKDVTVMAYKYDYLLIVTDMKDIQLGKLPAPKNKKAAFNKTAMTDVIEFGTLTERDNFGQMEVVLERLNKKPLVIKLVTISAAQQSASFADLIGKDVKIEGKRIGSLLMVDDLAKVKLSPPPPAPRLRKRGPKPG